MPAKSSGFRRADTPIRKRLTVAVDGVEKCGKTHFALTAPGPIAIQSVDMGLEGVIQKFQADKEIWLAERRMELPDGGLLKELSLEQTSAAAQKCVKEIISDFRDALSDTNIRTIIWDSATEVWEILRLARFGKLTQVKPHHYGPVNAEYKDLLRLANDSDKFLVLLHQMKDEYINDKRTGSYKRAGMSNTGFLVQVGGVCGKDSAAEDTSTKFSYTINDCRFNTELEGLSLTGTDCDFPHLAALVLDNDPEQYKGYV